MKNTILILIIMATGLLSCETVVEVDIPRGDNLLVVNGILEEDSSVQVRLSKSRFSLSSEPIEDVTGATITLFEEDMAVGTFKDTVINEFDKGWYVSDYQLKENTDYRLEVSKEGFPSLVSQMTVPKAIPIADLQFGFDVTSETIFINEQPVTVEGRRLTTIDLTIDDPADENNYYEVVVYEDGLSRFVFDYDENSDEFVITDSVRTRFLAYISTEDPVLTGGDVLDGGGSFFSSSLLFTDETFNGKRYTLNMNYEGSSGYSLDPLGNYIVFLRSLSREQFLYITSLQLQQQTEGNPFAEPVPVFNNIQGGYGIFVGYSHDSRRIKLTK